ncbi:MAG: peroxiredoxin family protein [candidate division Zixibacteria bacterium]|nr:peroxiredoxin family protein [candidate division Zixibacteria bacterium]
MAALEADRAKFKALGADIWGINPASVEVHDRYCDGKGFGFPILSDDGREVAKQYEAIKFPGLLIQRTVYVVGPKGTIVFAEQGMPADQAIMDAIEADRKR